MKTSVLKISVIALVSMLFFNVANAQLAGGFNATYNSVPASGVINISHTNPTTCSGTDGTATVTLTGLETVAWSTTPVQTTAIATGLAAGTYSATVTNPTGGCNIVVTTTLSDPGAPTVTLASSDVDNIICAGTSVTLTAVGATTYDFKVNGVSKKSGASATYTTTTLANTDVVSVTGTLTGCSASPTPVTMTVNSLPTASMSGVASACAGNQITVTITYSGGVGPYTVSTTTPTDLFSGTAVRSAVPAGTQNFIFSSATPKSINYQFTVIDANACAAQ